MHYIKTSLLAVLSTLFLAACSQNVKPTDANKTANPEPEIPNVELTGDLLYDILVGEIAGREGHFEVSILSLTRAAEKTRDPRLAERATKAAMYAKKYSIGLKSAKLWVDISPQDMEARESLAAMYLYHNEPAKAELNFEKVIKLAKQRHQLGETYLGIAGLMSQQRNRGAATEVMKKLAEIYPKNPEGQYAVAHLALRSGDVAVAEKAITRALDLRSDWDDAALLKGQILITARGGERIEKFYEHYISWHPKSYRVRLSYARYLVDLRRWERARDQFKEVVRLRPNDQETTYALGLLSLQTGHLEDADKRFRHVVELNPHNEQARLYLGEVAEKRKRYKEAAAWYGGITTPPHRFEAQLRLGIVMARQGKLDAALKHLSGIKARDEDEVAQRALAEEQILRESGKYQQAMKMLSSVLKQYPNNKDLLYSRALIAEKLGDLPMQERDLRRILKSDPKNAHALNALGYTLADHTNRHQEALALIRRALEVRPNDAYILDSMGWVHYRMGNLDEAIRYLKQALEIREDPEISAHLGEVLWVKGDREGAEAVWRRALKTTPDSEPLLTVIKKFKP
ncbi:MAG: tetratricopeptide repeat protein [Acidiferrobacterales bacterium]